MKNYTKPIEYFEKAIKYGLNIAKFYLGLAILKEQGGTNKRIVDAERVFQDAMQQYRSDLNANLVSGLFPNILSAMRTN